MPSHIRSIQPNKPPPERKKLLTNSRPWKKLRDQLYRSRLFEAAKFNESICMDCACENIRLYPMAQYQYHGHHIVPAEEAPHRLLDPTNVEFLCPSHHTLRNNYEQIAPLTNRSSRRVVYGKPGAGKTSFVRRHASDSAMVWDMDEHANTAFPRPEDEREQLITKRDRFLRTASVSTGEVWMIFRWPRTAWFAATKLGAECIRLDRYHPEGRGSTMKPEG